jgi:hypothetical protein
MITSFGIKCIKNPSQNDILPGLVYSTSFRDKRVSPTSKLCSAHRQLFNLDKCERSVDQYISFSDIATSSDPTPAGLCSGELPEPILKPEAPGEPPPPPPIVVVDEAEDLGDDGCIGGFKGMLCWDN